MVRCAQPMPAELTRTRKWPSSAACSTAAWICVGVGDVDLREDAADLVGEGLALVLLEVGDDDLRALRGELTGDGGADAGGAAGDECTGSCDVHGAELGRPQRSVRTPGHEHGRAGEQDPVVGGPGDREAAAGHVDAVGEVRGRRPSTPSATAAATITAQAPVPQDRVSPEPRSCTRMATCRCAAPDDELDVDAVRDRSPRRTPAASSSGAGVVEVVDERDRVRVAHVDVGRRARSGRRRATLRLAEHPRRAHVDGDRGRPRRSAS